ncbi:isoprenylcysteine carboxylmethyltransferase family protein [Spirosoma sp. KNUC1025]|uniref:methyltransferase family protein n=1 Tax=Spirosoma sp. KNUC1025 TaxID=2894082 RepID=UPI00386A3E30|nr:DUF1295 domain-containing protein [Spirosoma sp. KNUC1025]
MIYLVIVLSWIVFCGIHSITASLWFKQWVATRFGKLNRYYRLIYNGLALLTFLPVLWLHRMAPVDYVSSWQGSSWIGIVIIAIGLAVAVTALRGYDLAEFMGWPLSVNQSGQPALRQSGMLSYVRHPLYTGIVLLLLGIWLLQPSWSYLMLLLLGVLYIRIGIHFEERKLIATFGRTYQQYRERVPMLLPRF